jgi:hypothetical protein
MRVQLSGQMPPEATNGLSQHGKDFYESPLTLVPVVAMVAVVKKIEKTEDGEKYSVLKFHHIEVVGEENRAAFAEILGDELGRRTGADQLPFESGGEVPVKDPFPEESGADVGDLADEVDATIRQFQGRQ